MEMTKRRLLGALILSLFAAVLGDEKKAVKEGLDVELRCDYTISDPRVEWKFSSGQNTDLFIYYNGALTVPYQSRAQYFPHGLMLKSVTRKDTGEYVCEVTDSGGVNPTSHNYKTLLTVLVPPSVPVARVPTSVTIGSTNTLQCLESDASGPRTIVWYKDKVQLPQDPKNNPLFQNLTYTMDPTTGDLTFNPVTLANSGQYYCVVSNSEGQQKSEVVTMEAYEKNIGGIVAAVIVVLLILVLIGFLVWFAYSRGYIGKKANKKVIYSQPSETRSDKNFQQTSSFVV